MSLIPDDTIRLFIDVNKGVVRHIRDTIYIFVNKQLIGSVKNNSLEGVFKSIYNAEDLFIRNVDIEEHDKFNAASLFLLIELV